MAVLTLVVSSCRRGDGETFLTYFSNRHGVSLAYPASWKASQEEKDGDWYRTFRPFSAKGDGSSLVVTLFVAPTADLDAHATRYLGGLTSMHDETRPGWRGREYESASVDGTTHHRLLLLVPDDRTPDAVFGLHIHGAAATFEGSIKLIDTVSSSLRLERSAVYPEQRSTQHQFALRVPASWTQQRTLTRGDSFMTQYRSPPFVVDPGGALAHASLTLAVQRAPGDGGLDAYYKSVRANLGDAYPVLSHEDWRGGYADLMSAETTVIETRIKRYYRVAAGRAYSLTCEARDDVFAKMSSWCDIIAESLRVGGDVPR